MVSDVIREERLYYGLTQKQLGEIACASESLVCSIENGTRRPQKDFIQRVVTGINSVKLAVYNCFHCEAGMFNPPYMDRVDDHPVSVQRKLEEELEEALMAVRSISLLNKKAPEDLTEADRRQMDHVSEQLWDALAAIMMFAAVLSRTYLYDLRRAGVRAYQKYRSRGYVSYQAKEKSRS